MTNNELCNQKRFIKKNKKYHLIPLPYQQLAWYESYQSTLVPMCEPPDSKQASSSRKFQSRNWRFTHCPSGERGRGVDLSVAAKTHTKPVSKNFSSTQITNPLLFRFWGFRSFMHDVLEDRKTGWCSWKNKEHIQMTITRRTLTRGNIKLHLITSKHQHHQYPSEENKKVPLNRKFSSCHLKRQIECSKS